MTKKLTHILLVIGFISIYYINCLASNATPNVVKIYQPNGTFYNIRVFGDEFFGYKETLNGYMVDIGKDGYLYYVNLTPTGRKLSNIRLDSQDSPPFTKSNYNTIKEIRRYQLERWNSLLLNNNRGGLKLKELSKTKAGYSNTKTEIKSLVLLVEFSNLKFSVPNPKESFNAMLNTKGYSSYGATGSAKDYLNDNFNGLYNFNFVVSNVISLPSPIEKYGAHNGSINDTDVPQLVVDACNIAYNMGIDFSQFDCDMDGVVDNISIIFAGYGEEQGGPPHSIWSHQWNIIQKGISFNGVKLGSYSCSPELRGADGNIISSIGTFCHELSHSFGLQDMYDTNGSEEGESVGLYEKLSIMDRGNYLNNGNTPPYYNIIEREILGIVELDTLKSGLNYKLEPINKSSKGLKLYTSTEGEYFLLECRTNDGWDRYLTGEGLLVYHIDKSQNINGGISGVNRWKFNNVNAFMEHPCARVIEASKGDANNIAPIFYPGSNRINTLTYQGGHMQLREWNNRPVGVKLENITFKNSTVTFTGGESLSFDETLPNANIIEINPFKNDARVVWEGVGCSHNNCEWYVEWQDLTTNTTYHKFVTGENTIIDNLE